jgi:hypothetical protein
MNPINRRLPLGAAIVVTAVAILLSADAAASATTVLEKFKNCPKGNPQVAICVYAQSQYSTAKWEKPVPPSTLTAGNVTIPLRHNLALQGGLEGLVVENEPQPLFRPENGAPQLVPVPETIPGGLRATIDESMLSGASLEAYRQALKNHEGKVTATIESAPFEAPLFVDNTNLIELAEGTFITLPVKVKFDNPFLGPNCYAGSDAEPIVVELTDGTTTPPPPAEPMTGQEGILQGGKLYGKLREDSLVSNTFVAPAVEGCGREASWHEEVDAAINTKAGLPSAAGRNSTRIDGTQFLTTRETLEREGL